MIASHYNFLVSARDSFELLAYKEHIDIVNSNLLTYEYQWTEQC